MTTWTKASFQRRDCYQSDVLEDVRGWIANGLGLCRIGRLPTYQQWRLVHVASGYELGSAFYWSSLADAKAAVNPIINLTDWTRPREQFNGTDGIQKAVHEALGK